MSEHNSAVVALHNRIAGWQSEITEARANLAKYEQSVRHANNIIATYEKLIAELRAAIAKLEGK